MTRTPQADRLRIATDLIAQAKRLAGLDPDDLAGHPFPARIGGITSELRSVADNTIARTGLDPAPVVVLAGHDVDVVRSDQLLALVTDAQLDGNIHGQAAEQRERLARAKALALQIAAAARARQPELTVLHVRDADMACTVTLWTGDGSEYPGGWAEENIDAGAGHDAAEWAERIADAEALPPSDYRDEVVAILTDPPGARDHINGWDEIEDHLEEARARLARTAPQARA